jgi:hypothetical protein
MVCGTRGLASPTKPRSRKGIEDDQVASALVDISTQFHQTAKSLSFLFWVAWIKHL